MSKKGNRSRNITDFIGGHSEALGGAMPDLHPMDDLLVKYTDINEIRSILSDFKYVYSVTLTIGRKKLRSLDAELLILKVKKFMNDLCSSSALQLNYLLYIEHHEDGVVHFHGYMMNNRVERFQQAIQIQLYRHIVKELGNKKYPKRCFQYRPLIDLDVEFEQTGANGKIMTSLDTIHKYCTKEVHTAHALYGYHYITNLK